MPDLNYSILIHRKNLQKIWRSTLWSEARTKFLDAHPDMKCERCGVVGVIVPGHTEEDYLDMPQYIPKVAENRVEALCPKCNRKQAKGMKPCPACIKAYQITNGEHWIRYIPQFMELCRDCCDPGEVAIQKREQEKFKAFVKENRKENNKRDNEARRPLLDAQNKKKRKFYRMVKKNGKRTG